MSQLPAAAAVPLSVLIAGAVWSLAGGRAARTMAAPLVFLLIAIPLPALVVNEVTLDIQGKYAWFWGVEIFNSDPTRFSSNGAPPRRGTAVHLSGDGTRMINMIVHDTSQGVLTGEGAANDVMWHHGYLFARALTIGGGTGEVQRNIIAERVLGLPREPKA